MIRLVILVSSLLVLFPQLSSLAIEQRYVSLERDIHVQVRECVCLDDNGWPVFGDIAYNASVSIVGAKECRNYDAAKGQGGWATIPIGTEVLVDGLGRIQVCICDARLTNMENSQFINISNSQVTHFVVCGTPRKRLAATLCLDHQFPTTRCFGYCNFLVQDDKISYFDSNELFVNCIPTFLSANRNARCWNYSVETHVKIENNRISP